MQEDQLKKLDEVKQRLAKCKSEGPWSSLEYENDIQFLLSLVDELIASRDEFKAGYGRLIGAELKYLSLETEYKKLLSYYPDTEQEMIQEIAELKRKLELAGKVIEAARLLINSFNDEEDPASISMIQEHMGHQEDYDETLKEYEDATK